MRLLDVTDSPDGESDAEWAVIVAADPGAAFVRWLSKMDGANLEIDGENRGPWLRRNLRGGDGLAYCADIYLSWSLANGVPLPEHPGHRRDSYWHNRAVQSLMASWQHWGGFCGHLVPPRVGWACFRLRGGQHHVDWVTGYCPRDRMVNLIGANVGDEIKSTQVALSKGGVIGWGAYPETLKA